jgi:acetyl-CoA C-acetyltransferase
MDRLPVLIGAGAALEGLDTVGIIDVMGWRPANAPRLLAERLGANVKQEWQSGIGGDIPLVLANRAARDIAEGKLRFALLAGTNNYRTARRARDARHKLEWPQGGDGTPERIGKNRMGNSPAEAEYGIGQPTDVYPLFENALRARRGRGLEEHRLAVGELMSGFTRVATENPYAWFPVERSAQEIATVTATNRMISYPYTKYMNAVMETDQAAAVLLCSVAAARELGVPEERWVYWWGGANGVEADWYPSERRDFSRCEAMGTTARSALDEAGIAASDVAAFDFYSCFPVAVEMAIESLGLAEDDPRGFTVTGGLPYAGGPGNNYTLHSLAAMVERLRSGPGGFGLVTGNGWYLTKHSATVIGSAPPAAAPSPALAAPAAPEIADDTQSTQPAQGTGVIETYTVVYDRDTGPRRGVVVGRTSEGKRFVANTPDDRQLLEDFAAVENVGRSGAVRHEDGANVFEPA